ncbi:acyl-CoA dehydrogenase family protein [Siccirubricoccus sp. G192]|uniref:acyl-CoA dehydrogenase family protein n=1 Tax=Siccirubricoccus sp. G192 TaxID=2849651 RepID=UPI001C2C8BB6|nr:acyl-CoA dehydrogenase family protein [Siccirubricoccus sp. G192]MBV1796473.1 acyl-CoA/acyl-ACP dehydrogenase [Siccirubricoccus sp. G192]
MKNGDALLEQTRIFAAELAAQRSERQRSRQLNPVDFERLREIGFHEACIPIAHGGLWEGPRRSARILAEAYRALAGGDPSLALAASMHPAVLSFWRDAEVQPDQPGAEVWEAQRRDVFVTALDGAWWGTITSEPGSGGDIGNTRAVARRDAAAAGGWRITGEKHFGSGSGVTSCMITTALPEGEAEPAWFVFDMRGVPWDGSTGMALRAEWDGHGMAATNSHSFTFRDFPAAQMAWPGHWRQVIEGHGGSSTILFVAVILGVVDAAMAYMDSQLRARGAPASTLPAFEKVEWVMAQREAWLAQQAYDGALHTLERHGRSRRDAQMAKANLATLAESIMTRLCRIAGGGAYARHSPLGFWFEDVRAAGFLRPPWSVALEGLYAIGWEATAAVVPNGSLQVAPSAADAMPASPRKAAHDLLVSARV